MRSIVFITLKTGSRFAQGLHYGRGARSKKARNEPTEAEQNETGIFTMTETWGCIQPWASFDPLPIFINKVLLECRQAHLYTCFPWLLWGGTAQLSSNHEGWGNQIMYFLIWPLIEDVSAVVADTQHFPHQAYRCFFPGLFTWPLS